MADVTIVRSKLTMQLIPTARFCMGMFLLGKPDLTGLALAN